jgi:type II secretory ATPase GspE/PulE/Tfp pilus assembly ATPase PilB-like protein
MRSPLHMRPSALVFSTLHTNSAAQTVTRLIEIGIPPYLVNATLAGALAQQMSPAIRRLVAEHASHERLEEEAVAEGMTRLTAQALAMARAGIISFDEVLRVRLD